MFCSYQCAFVTRQSEQHHSGTIEWGTQPAAGANQRRDWKQTIAGKVLGGNTENDRICIGFRVGVFFVISTPHAKVYKLILASSEIDFSIVQLDISLHQTDEYSSRIWFRNCIPEIHVLKDVDPDQAFIGFRFDFFPLMNFFGLWVELSFL